MTAAQKMAKAKFKQAIAYRQKTGVSLKEAFAHIYGKKKAAKKVVRKKSAKKVGNVTLKKSNRFKGDERYIIMNDGHKHLEGKPFFKQTAKEVASALRKVKAKRKKSAKKVGTIKKRITEKSILNKIHTVKRNVERLDEAQHKHMLGRIKAKPTVIALAKKIRRQTDMNEHNLAILSLAKFLKDKKSIELMNNVIKMHNNYNYMPKDLINIRDTIYSQLMTTLKHKYGQVDYKEIEHSF